MFDSIMHVPWILHMSGFKYARALINIGYEYVKQGSV